MKISIVLPTYNEAGNIIDLVTDIINHVNEKWDYEIIIIDDNSPDKTYSLVRDAFFANPKVIPVLRTQDRGFAQSIRVGLEMSTGEKVIVMDTDYTHDPMEIPRLIHISLLYDIVSASRFCSGGNMQSIRHYYASFLYNLFIRLVLHTQVQDNLGGYFIINKKGLELLPFDVIFHGYGEYFFRLLYFAKIKSLSIVEIPAYYHARTEGASKSSVIKMIYSYTVSLIKLRLKIGWKY